MTGHEPVILPQKRPFESVYTLQVDSSNIGRTSPWTDVSPEIGYGPQQQAYFRAYAATQQRAIDVQNTGKDGNESDTMAPSDPESSPAQRLTRQKAKQLDRELPWREIVAMPKAHIQKFLAAIEKEASSWSERGPIKPLTEEEIAKIKSDPPTEDSNE